MAKQPISLDRFRQAKQQAQKVAKNSPLEGVLVWLHCPTCHKIEYTEIVAPQGRTHSCGTVVEEEEVTLDLRAELSLTLANIERIDALLAELKVNRLKKLLARSMEKTLFALKDSEQVYAERLQKTAPAPLSPYELSLAALAKHGCVAEVNALGLLVSMFRHSPENRFKAAESDL